MPHSQNQGTSRSAFTLKELLVSVAVIGALCALALPFVQMARENARRNSCSSNLHIIGVALMNYENKHGCFPPISSNLDAIADIPGDSTATSNSPTAKYSADSPAAGFSWAVWILPEIEEATLYQAIVNNSRTFADPAFSPAIVSGPGGNSAQHLATVQLSVFRCPSFSGGPVLDTSPRTIGSPRGAIETGSIPPNYLAAIATANGAAGIAITNYNAILGTHIDNVGPAVPPFPVKSASLPNSNNGGMKFRGAVYDQGFRLADFPMA
jgi:type II secretory pathway pseudopilin PulG